MNESSPMYSESRARRKGSVGGSMVITLLFILILALAGGMAWLYLQMQQQGSEVGARLLVIEQNQNLLKETLQITDKNFSDVEMERNARFDTVNTRLDTADDEIRKLWNLANGRNKDAIQALESDIATTNNQLRTLQETVKTDQQNTQQIATQIEAIQTSITNIDQDIRKLVEVQTALARKIEEGVSSEVIKSIDGRIASLESQRGQNNSRLGSLQQDMSLLRSRLLALENSLQLPTNAIQ